MQQFVVHETVDDARSAGATTAPAPGRAPIAPPVITWREPPGGFGRPALRDALIVVATLGLYRCWSKPAFRRRLWASIEIDGIPLGYTGTPRDHWRPLLWGLTALAGMMLAAGFWKVLHLPMPGPRTLRSPWRFVLTVPLLILAGQGRYRGRNYLLSHTTLLSYATGRANSSTGEPVQLGSMTGHGLRFGLRYLGGTLAIALTLFLALPWRTVHLHRRLAAETRVDGMPLSLDAEVKPLYRPFWLTWFGCWIVYLSTTVAVGMICGRKILDGVQRARLPELSQPELAACAVVLVAGLAAFAVLAAWYQAHVEHHLWNATRWNGLRCRLATTPARLFRTRMKGLAITIASLGLLADIARMQHTRAIVKVLSFEPDARRDRSAR